MSGRFMKTCSEQRQLILDSVVRQEECLDYCKKISKLNYEMADLAQDPRAKANYFQIAKFYETEAVEIFRTEIQVKNLNLELVSEAMRRGCQEIEEAVNAGT